MDIQYIVIDNVHIHMNRLHLVFVFRILDQVITDIQIARCSFADIAINEVRTTLNHSLVDQLLERLVFADITQIIQELIPETTIDQVSSSMFATTQIQIHLSPIIVRLLADQCLVIVRIHVAQIIR